MQVTISRPGLSWSLPHFYCTALYTFTELQGDTLKNLQAKITEMNDELERLGIRKVSGFRL